MTIDRKERFLLASMILARPCHGIAEAEARWTAWHELNVVELADDLVSAYFNGTKVSMKNWVGDNGVQDVNLTPSTVAYLRGALKGELPGPVAHALHKVQQRLESEGARNST